MTTEPEVAARIKRVRATVVYGHKSKVTERIERREFRIDAGAVVVPPARTHVLISESERDFIVHLIRVTNRFDEHPVAAAFVRIIDVRMKGRAFDGARIFAAGESRRQGERTIVEPRV